MIFARLWLRNKRDLDENTIVDVDAYARYK
jgi:hypothetical protein